MKNCSFIILLIAFCNQSLAQDSKVKIHRIGISDLTFQSGFNGNNLQSFYLSDFQKLAPQSILLTNNYQNYSDNHFSMEGNHITALSFGIQIRNNKKNEYRNNVRFRFGLSYYNSTYFGSYKESQTDSTYDVLTSTQSNMVVWFDSIYTKGILMTYNYNQLRFNASIIFQTSPAKRFSLFSGVGISLGTSLKTTSEVSYNENVHSEAFFPDGSDFYSSPNYDWRSNNYNGVDEVFTNKNNFNYGFYIPVGVDFKFGKKSFWKLLHLTYEMRGGINYLSIPELHTYNSKSISALFGLKFGR